MERQEELYKLVESVQEETKIIANKLIEHILFLEERLDELKHYPFLQVHPKNSMLQRTTPAAKQYKELLQQYTNCIKTLSSMFSEKADGKDSPLRTYMKNRLKQYESE